MSKESVIKKRIKKQVKQNTVSEQPVKPKTQRIVASQVKRPVRRLNRRFIITFGIWLIAFGLALYFVMR